MLVIVNTKGNIIDLAANGVTEIEWRHAGYKLEEFALGHSIKEVTEIEWKKYCEEVRYRLAVSEAGAML